MNRTDPTDGFATRLESGGCALVINSAYPSVGEAVEVTASLTGRADAAAVTDVSLAVEVRCRTAEGYRSVTPVREQLVSELRIKSGFRNVRATTIEIPHSVPGTVGPIDVWVTVSADFRDGTETRTEYLDVEPAPQTVPVLDAMTDLGFQLCSIECRVDDRPTERTCLPCFRFRPVRRSFRGEFDLIDVLVRSEAHAATVFTTIDPDGRYPIAEVAPSAVRIEDPAPDAVRRRLESHLAGLL